MVSDGRRIRLTEEDAMEGGVQCPNCGSYNAFGDIIATGQCRNAWRPTGPACRSTLALDLIVRQRGNE